MKVLSLLLNGVEMLVILAEINSPQHLCLQSFILRFLHTFLSSLFYLCPLPKADQWSLWYLAFCPRGALRGVNLSSQILVSSLRTLKMQVNGLLLTDIVTWMWISQ